MHAALQALDGGLSWEIFLRQFEQLYAVMNAANVILLRNPP
jgi:hypothetical protein